MPLFEWRFCYTAPATLICQQEGLQHLEASKNTHEIQWPEERSQDSVTSKNVHKVSVVSKNVFNEHWTAEKTHNAQWPARTHATLSSQQGRLQSYVEDKNAQGIAGTPAMLRGQQ